MLIAVLKRLGLRVVRIDGGSMAPAFEHGDYAVFRRYGRRSAGPQVGDAVLVDHPQYGTIVKRVARRPSASAVELAGDAVASTPGIDLGAVPTHRIWGRLLWHAAPNRRRPSDVCPSVHS